MMQKSTVTGSQATSGVTVSVGVKDGLVVEGGDGDVTVATSFVFTITTGVSAT